MYNVGCWGGGGEGGGGSMGNKYMRRYLYISPYHKLLMVGGGMGEKRMGIEVGDKNMGDAYLHFIAVTRYFRLADDPTLIEFVRYDLTNFS